MGCYISTTIGTLCALRVFAGMRSKGRCSRSTGERSAGSPPSKRLPDDAARAPPMQRPATEASPRTSRLERTRARKMGWRAIVGRSVPARIQFGAAVRPVDVRLERLHRGRVRIQLLSLGGLLDAPVDHVAQGGELPDLLLKLRELVGVRIGREWMAHGACRPRPAEPHVQLLLRAVVSVEEQVPDAHLFHEHFLECLEL